MPHAGLLDKESLSNLVSLINLELLSASILQSGNPLMIGLLQQSVKGMNAVFEKHASASNMPEQDSFSIKKILDNNSPANVYKTTVSNPNHRLFGTY
uniref:Uncharacterized protein n=1 Tax=Ditylenchus dipsaci TaxID=166011 RepID=A0A915DK95_9BILA